LRFAAGDLIITPGFMPAIDRAALAAHEIAGERFVSPSFAAVPNS